MRTRTFVSRKEGIEDEGTLKAWEEDGDNEMKEIGGKKSWCSESEEENRCAKIPSVLLLLLLLPGSPNSKRAIGFQLPEKIEE